MSFWSLSDGDSAANTGNEFDAGGGDFENIPKNTSVLAVVDEASWREDRSGNEHLSIRWGILKPEAYANRKIFQKMWITDDNPNSKDAAKKRDKDLKMLGAIDANAGGKLVKKAGKPTDDDLALALTNKPMVITLGEWSMKADDGSTMTGNWVMSVKPKTAEISAGPVAKKPASRPAIDEDEDQIPF